MKSKRILFLLSRFLDGGIDTVMVEYVNTLCRLTHHKVTVAIGINYSRMAEVYLDRLDRRVEVVHIVSNAMLTYNKRAKLLRKKNRLLNTFDELLLNPIRRAITQYKLNNLMKQHDVIIDFDSCHASYMPRGRHQKTRIAFFHFSFEQEASRDHRRMERLSRGFRCYDKIVTISDAMMDEGIKLYPEWRHKFCRIYNCIDPTTIDYKAARPVADERITTPYLLAVERLEEKQKDLSTLIEAYALLPALTPPLYIIGEGRSHQDLQTKIDALGLSQRVVLLGFIANPYPWLRHAEVVVHSSKFEGLPTVLIEALMLGKIIVATDCPTGPAEILDHGKAGILTPVGDTKALAHAIETALNDTDTRSILEREALSHRKIFMPQTSIAQLEQLF